MTDTGSCQDANAAPRPSDQRRRPLLATLRNQIETIHPPRLQIDRLLVPAEVLVSWQLLQNHLTKVPRESSALEGFKGEDCSLDASTLLVAFILKNSQF